MTVIKSIFGVVKDVAKIATAPVEVVVDLTRGVTKPTADVAKEIAEAVKKGVNPD